jgi:hypothetical protein
VVALVLFVFGGYTPTTTAYVDNDTTHTVTLRNCADIPLTVIPGTKEKIEPFENAGRAACTVFYGEASEGRPNGCLYPVASHGQTVSGAVVRVSAMRPVGQAGCH